MRAGHPRADVAPRRGIRARQLMVLVEPARAATPHMCVGMVLIRSVHTAGYLLTQLFKQ